MNIKQIVTFLKKAENKIFFKKLQSHYPYSINQIQALVTRNPEKPIRDLLSQIKLQHRINYKIRDADKYLFTEKGAEQCSSSTVAEYNGSKFRNFKIIADLCCGVGMDLLSIASEKDKVYAVDSDDKVLKFTKYNCNVEGHLNIDLINSQAEEFNASVEAVFLDPDRRKGGKRTNRAEDYSPSLQDILELNKKYPNMVVKLSPLFNYDTVRLPENSTLEFVSEMGILKEILLCTGKLRTAGVARKAVLLPNRKILNQKMSVIPQVSDIQQYIFEPDASIIRGGLVEDLAEEMGFCMISRKSALLTSQTPAKETYGKLYRVIEILPYSLKKLQNYLKNKQIGDLVLKTRGPFESVESLRKKLKLKGEGKAIILLIKLVGKPQMLILSRKGE